MDRLNKILCEVFQMKETDLNPTLTMGDIEKWDSLTHMDLISSIETGYDIELSMDEIMEMKDIGSIYRVVKGRVS